MKKSAFDRRNIQPGKTVALIFIYNENKNRTTRSGLITEVKEDTITMIHGSKIDTYKIEDIIGISIQKTI